MDKKEKFLESAFHIYAQRAISPTEHQKDIILNRIIMECQAKDIAGFRKWNRLLVVYPWRAAFAASAVQAIVFTSIFGTQYTNLFLGIWGG